MKACLALYTWYSVLYTVAARMDVEAFAEIGKERIYLALEGNLHMRVEGPAQMGYGKLGQRGGQGSERGNLAEN